MTAVAKRAFWASIRGVSRQGTPRIFNRRLLGSALLAFFGYYLGSQIGFALTFQPHPVSVLWPPNSILLAALLLTPTRSWWFVLLAVFPAHCLAQSQSEIPWPMILCYFVSNCCEALIGAGCIRSFAPGQIRFDNLRNTALFCFFGGLVAPFLSSFLDAGFVQLNKWGAGNYWEIWRIRFFSNVLTALTFAPAIVMGFARGEGRSRQWKRQDYLETAALFLGLIAISYLALYKKEPSGDPLLFYGPLAFLLWAALRLGSRVTINAILIITFLAIWSAAHGHGPFTAESPEENARSIQMFLIVIAVPFLFLAAGIEERRTADERFAKAFRASPNAMSITRLSDGTLFDVNQEWLSMYGYRRGEVIGRTVFDLELYPSPEDRAIMVRRLGNGETVRDFEGSVRTKKKGTRRVLFSAERVELAGETCLIIITQDVTDRKLVEQADRDLAHASRLAVVGELTASIAHEINQPLGAILSNAEAAEMLLESDSPPLDEVRRILADIRKDDVRASETIQHIRLLTRKREMRMELLDLNEIAFEVMRLVAADARRRKIPVRTEFIATPTTVFGDRIHLQQVLMNLVLNAMDAMTDIPENERQLFVRIATNGEERIEVSVTDSGRGILPEKLPRLFDSFFTTKEDGMGLGLAIARSIIDAHQGHIFAENNLERGATFRFDLPIPNGEVVRS
jgi:two-component system sensor kinase FixL